MTRHIDFTAEVYKAENKWAKVIDGNVRTMPELKRLAKKVWAELAPDKPEPKIYTSQSWDAMVREGKVNSDKVGSRRDLLGRTSHFTSGKTYIVMCDRTVTTLLHEVAHAIQFAKDEDCGHGNCHDGSFVKTEKQVWEVFGLGEQWANNLLSVLDN